MLKYTDQKIINKVKNVCNWNQTVAYDQVNIRVIFN